MNRALSGDIVAIKLLKEEGFNQSSHLIFS